MPFGIVHRRLTLSLSIVVFWIIKRHGSASRNFSATYRLLFFTTDLIRSFRAQHSGIKELYHPKSPNNSKLPVTSTILPTSAQLVKQPDYAKEPKVKYADFLKLANKQVIQDSSPLKTVEYINGMPRIFWIEDEMDKMIVIEGLQFVLIGKLSYGWPDLEDSRNEIPK
ncbi:hypothetical protein H5410_056985 [Solanum commersonii]|uniref:Uncharacterized protein n=1 Tax=Solanum commersonii TaxID=4109 RepID=A0A9J5WLR0_SOLCO|nr:hypothetical protein H5410_056985 [Solanum commersonii]